MNASDQGFGFLDVEGVYFGTVFLGQAEAFQPGGRTGFAWEVLVAEFERAAQGAGAVVVGLLRRPALSGGYLSQLGVENAFKFAVAETGAPVVIDESPIVGVSRIGQVIVGDSQWRRKASN